MDSNRIQELLDKYWNCETSLEEEKALRDYFSKQPIPEQLQEAGQLFQYFALQQEQSMAVTDEENVKAILRPKETAGVTRKFVSASLKIAAGIAVVVISIWFVHRELQTEQPTELVDTYSNPKEAFEETKKALLMISKSFSTAEEQAQKINIFNDAQEIIQGDTQKIDQKKNLRDS